MVQDCGSVSAWLLRQVDNLSTVTFAILTLLDAMSLSGAGGERSAPRLEAQPCEGQED